MGGKIGGQFKVIGQPPDAPQPLRRSYLKDVSHKVQKLDACHES